MLRALEVHEGIGEQDVAAGVVRMKIDLEACVCVHAGRPWTMILYHVRIGPEAPSRHRAKVFTNPLFISSEHLRIATRMPPRIRNGRVPEPPERG